MPSSSFPPSHRLHHPWEYRRFFGKNEVLRTSECAVFRITNDRGHARLGISFKARGRSIDRNRTKRVIREYFRAHAPALGAFDYNVVIPGSKALTFPYPQKLREALDRELVSGLSRFQPARPPGPKR